MGARVVTCLLILGVLGTRGPLSAQRARPEATQALRTFRLIATGANNQPVTDLRPEEVQLTDEGKRYPLVFARLLRSAPAASLSTAAAPGPREFSNRGSDRLSASTLIFIDLLNANITERGATWNETVQSLRGMESAENVFLYFLTPDANLFELHGWDKFDPAAPPPATPWTKQIRTLLDQALRTVEKLKPVNLTAYPGLTADPTYQALSALGRAYAALPGQKRIVWITHGMPLTVQDDTGNTVMDFRPALKETGAEFSRLGISLYTVHQQDRSTSGIASQETLQGLPPLTGGRWFENDAVVPAIAQAQVDARATYEAAYYAPANADGKTRKLRVSTTRKGVRLLAEESYLDVAPQELDQSNLELVSSRPFDTPDIGLRASLAASAKATHVEIHADLHDLLLQHEGAASTGSISLSFIYYNADGTQAASRPVVRDISLTKEQLDGAMKDGFLFTADLNVPSGTKKLRLIVQDGATGIAGSLSVPAGSP